MVRFTVEMDRVGKGMVAARIRDTENATLVFEVTVVTDDTKTSQERVVATLANHLNWFVDLSQGGTK